MSSVGQTLTNWGSTVWAAGTSAGQTIGHALHTGGAKFVEISKFGVQKLGEVAVSGKDAGFYYSGVMINKISAAFAAAKQHAVDGYAVAKPKAIALASSAQSSFLAFNAASVAKVGVVFDSAAKLSPAAVAPYSGYAVLGAVATVSAVAAGYILKNRIIDLTKDLKKEEATAIEDAKKDAAKGVAVAAGDVADGAAVKVYTTLTGNLEGMPSEATINAVKAIKTELDKAKQNEANAQDKVNAAAVDETEFRKVEGELTASKNAAEVAQIALEAAQDKLVKAKEQEDNRTKAIAAAENELGVFDLLHGELEAALKKAQEAKAAPIAPDAPARDEGALDQAISHAQDELNKHVGRDVLDQAVTKANAEEQVGIAAIQQAVEAATTAVADATKDVAAKETAFNAEKGKLEEKQAALDARKKEFDAAQKIVNEFNADDKVVAAVAKQIADAEVAGIKAENGKVTGTLSYRLQNAALKTAGVGLALFSTVTTASTIGFVAGNAIPVAAAYAIGAIVPTASYFLVKTPADLAKKPTA